MKIVSPNALYFFKHDAMKKILLLLLVSSSYLFIACSSANPETYFGLAVLNSNLMHGFAGNGMLRELESPSVKMVDGDVNNLAPMTRKEMVDAKVQTLEANLKKLKGLKETDDTRNLLQASAAIYDYVLPVYKNEYQELAKLYDTNAPRENIQSYSQSISDKYYPGYLQLVEKMTTAGKAFADKNGIKVNWDVRTSPR